MSGRRIKCVVGKRAPATRETTDLLIIQGFERASQGIRLESEHQEAIDTEETSTWAANITLLTLLSIHPRTRIRRTGLLHKSQKSLLVKANLGFHLEIQSPIPEESGETQKSILLQV